MNKTLQEQYNLIKEGKGSKEHFMRTVRHTFPNLITPTLSYNDTVTVLKNKSIISESIGGLVTTGRKQDWHSIFKENMNFIDYGSWKKELINIIKKDANLDDNEIAVNEEEIKKYYNEGKSPKEVYYNIWQRDAGNFWGIPLNEAKEAKAEEKEPTKDVVDMETKGYDYKDKKNYDNVFGQEFLKGFYTEMGDSKNEGKTVEELRAIVAKNLAKDINHYVKDGQFGLKGVGYTTEAPSLGTPKEAKGKHKSSGYGDLKESAIRALISEMVKEVLAEVLRPEDKETFSVAADVAEKLYDEEGSVKAALAKLPAEYANFKDELEQHLTQKFEG